MGFEIINKLKKEKGLTNAQLAQMSGVTLSTLDKITAGINTNPKLDTLQAICRALGCRLDDFDDAPTKKAPLYSSEAMEIAWNFDSLDRHGRRIVRSVMDEEIARMAELDGLEEEEPERTPKIIPLYLSPYAAGIASPVFGQDYDNYEISPDDPQGATFAVKVQGDSLEPDFPDGSFVFCNRDPLRDGDIGVFYITGSGGVIKQYHYDETLGMTYLFSLNRKRDDADVLITKTSGQDMVCQGRVITKKRYPIPGKF